MEADRRERRLAENEATVRGANERIEETAQELGFSGLVPFLCECGDESCTEVVLVSLSDYESVRSRSNLFLILPAHEEVARATGRIVERRERFLVAEKTGEAGEVVSERDPRASKSAR